MNTPEHTPIEYAAIFPTPFGALGIRCAADHLTGIDFLAPGTMPKAASGNFENTVIRALHAYFADPRTPFTLPLQLAGTPFRQRVWAAIAAIPPGRTVTYGDIARQLNSSARAVGQATGDNPIPIIIPCHRVLAAHGLGGFMHSAGDFSLGIKKWLLAHEGIRG